MKLYGEIFFSLYAVCLHIVHFSQHLIINASKCRYVYLVQINARGITSLMIFVELKMYPALHEDIRLHKGWMYFKPGHDIGCLYMV